MPLEFADDIVDDIWTAVIELILLDSVILEVPFKLLLLILDYASLEQV